MSFSDIVQRIIILLAVVTSMGTLVHDTKIDKAYQLAVPLIGASLAAPQVNLGEGASHTHVERVSGPERATQGMPRIQARNDHRKYYLTKSLSRTSDFFGGSRILWPSV